MKHNRKDKMITVCVYLEALILKLNLTGVKDLESLGSKLIMSWPWEVRDGVWANL